MTTDAIRRSTNGNLTRGDLKHRPSGELNSMGDYIVGSFSGGAAKRSSSAQVRAAMDSVYAPIAEPLTIIESRIAKELQSPYEAVGEVLRHGTQLGGKRLRPALMLLAASAAGGVNEDHITLGTVIEMVHTATLIHDDVIDDAETRRHVATINARFSNDASILLGDYLFAQAYGLAASLPTTHAARAIAEAARLVCEGELRQVVERNQFEFEESAYIEMIRGKTAQLCRVACELGVHYAVGSPAEVDVDLQRRLSRYGDAVGIAFQIADDYLDLWGNDSAVGKTLGTDLLQGKWTWPIINLYQRSDNATRNRLHDILCGPAERRHGQLMPYLDAIESQAQTAAKAIEYRDSALAAISDLPDTAVKTALVAIAHFSVARTF